MALEKCGECGNQVSTKADKCPSCGAKVKRGSKGWLVLLLIVGFFMWASARYQDSDVSTASVAGGAPASGAKPAPAAPPTPPAPPEPGAQWRYSKGEDEMTGKVTRSASVSSTNRLLLSWPYEEPQRGSLIVRHHPRFGKDAIVKIDRGQILCRSYEDCIVLVRFDDAEPVRYRATGPSDNSTTLFFFRDYPGFTSRALSADRVRVSFEMYQNGVQMLEFDVSGFSQDKFMK